MQKKDQVKKSIPVKGSVTAVLLIAVSIVLFWFIQRLLMPKYQKGVVEGSFTEEYYKETVPHEVIFFGDCDVYENYSPIKMYQEYGISAYIRGSGEQYIWQSYYLLRDTLRHETPKVVVLTVHGLQFDKTRYEPYNRMTLDGMKWSKDKVDAINASMTKGEAFASYVFPILRYHDRWNELTPTDFKHVFSKDITSHNGYYMRCDVMPFSQYPPQQPLMNPNFGSNAMGYLDKIRELCEEKGIKLVLVRAPLEYGWYPQWDKNVEKYAAQYGLTYLNFNNYTKEIGLDLTKDTYDAGVHLNLSGAEKLSVYFGKYLKDNYGLTDFRNDPAVSAVHKNKIAFYDFMREDQEREIREYGALKSYGANAIE